MTETQRESRGRLDAIYANTMALYAALKDTSFDLRRAELKHNEVSADPIDFCADVELKAKKHLTAAEYIIWSIVQIDPEQYKYVPERIRQTLGRVFKQNRLDMSGDYKRLYFKIKNQQVIQELTPREDYDGS